MIARPRSFSLRRLSAALVAPAAVAAALLGANPVVALASDNHSGAPNPTTNTAASSQNTCPPGDHGIYDYTVYVNGQRVPRLLGYVKQGDQVTVDVKACATTEVSLASYTTTGPTWDYSRAAEQKIFDSSSVSLVDGQEGELKVNVPACYNQEDLVYGAPITDGAPIYTGRLIDGNNGGTEACAVVTPTPTPTPTPTACPPDNDPAPIVNVTVNDNDPTPPGMPWWLIPVTAAITVLGMTGAFLLGKHMGGGKAAVLPVVAPPAKSRTASVSAHAKALLGAIMERRGINQQLALSEAVKVQEIVDQQIAAGNTLYAVRGGKAQILFDAKQHTRRDTTAVMSYLARSNAPCSQAHIADILAHKDTNTDLEMESGHAEAIAKLADAKGHSHGAMVENSLYQMNRVDSKLHAGYRIVAAKSREDAVTSAATPVFDSMSNLAVGNDAKYAADARTQGREMSDYYRSLPHYTTRSDLRSLTVASQTIGFHPEVQDKIDHAQETLFVA